MRDFKLAFDAIGTHWVIDCFESKKSSDEIAALVRSRIDEFDKTYSRFRDDSLVWKISKNKGEYVFPPDGKEIFDLYEKLYKITDEKFTLLIGNTLDEAGYDSDYSLKPKHINKVPKNSEIFSYSHPTLKTKVPTILDFGGLGKGYLIDIVGKLLLDNGVESFCIDGGGDILYKTRSEKPLTVGLENPVDIKQVIGVAKIIDQSICASSGNRRRWDQFHHIINPKTLLSPEDILATWVISKSALISDAMATCLFLTSKEELRKHFEFEYLILYPDFSIDKSSNFPAELFIKN